MEMPADPNEPGANLSVFFLVVPALDGNPDGHAWAEHPGGPGGSTVQLAAQFAIGGSLERLRRNRDVLLMDQRGVGESGALICEALAEPRILEPYFSRPRVEACKQEMEERGLDLRHYSTIAAVDDLEAIRTRLRYQQLDLGGWSYGSKFMLTYAHRYPDRVRTIAVFVPTIANYRRPVDWARFTEAALEGMFEDCAAQADCAAAYPELRGDFERLVESLDRQPITAEYVHPNTGARISAVIDRARLIDELHYALIRVPRLRRLPQLIHRAAAGDMRPFVDFAVGEAAADTPPAEALYLSVVCPEEVARITPADSIATRSTFVGMHFIDEFRMVCEIWNLPPHSAYPLDWQPLDIPALVVAGDRDPLTPVEDGETIAAGFQSARLLPIHRMPHHSMGLAGSECLDEILLQFLAEANAGNLDASCVADMQARPFIADTAGG
jgi:pimeloyl-ACP methyl ester carboxylesterase